MSINNQFEEIKTMLESLIPEHFTDIEIELLSNHLRTNDHLSPSIIDPLLFKVRQLILYNPITGRAHRRYVNGGEVITKSLSTSTKYTKIAGHLVAINNLIAFIMTDKPLSHQNRITFKDKNRANRKWENMRIKHDDH